jgi:hypothetical protein
MNLAECGRNQKRSTFKLRSFIILLKILRKTTKTISQDSRPLELNPGSSESDLPNDIIWRYLEKFFDCKDIET